MSVDAPPRAGSNGKAAYLDAFGLNDAPFRTTPSPRYTYLTRATQEAIAHTRHAIEAERGLVAISGEIGTGKTTICRNTAEEAQAEGHSVAFLYRVPGGSKQTESKIYAAIAEDLRLPAARSRSAEATLARIQEHAMETAAKGRTTVVFIDDAHSLRGAGVNVILSLLNLQSADAQLIQVVLYGQLPEMADVLRADRALHSRLAVHTMLTPLTRKDVQAMVQHRLLVAGREEPLFTSAAINSLYERSRGIPRKVCTIGDLACLLAWDESAKMVDKPHVIEAADRLQHEADK